MILRPDCLHARPPKEKDRILKEESRVLTEERIFTKLVTEETSHYFCTFMSLNDAFTFPRVCTPDPNGTIM